MANVQNIAMMPRMRSAHENTQKRILDNSHRVGRQHGSMNHHSQAMAKRIATTMSMMMERLPCGRVAGAGDQRHQCQEGQEQQPACDRQKRAEAGRRARPYRDRSPLDARTSALSRPDDGHRGMESVETWISVGRGRNGGLDDGCAV